MRDDIENVLVALKLAAERWNQGLGFLDLLGTQVGKRSHLVLIKALLREHSAMERGSGR